MKNVEPSLVDYLKHYATLLKHPVALRVLEGKAIEDEKEARALLGFLNAMLDQAVKDQNDGVKVLGQLAHASDAEKAHLAMQDFIEESGFADVLGLDEDG